VLKGRIEINAIPFFQEYPLIVEQKFRSTAHDEEKLLPVMAVRIFLGDFFRDGEEKRLHLFVLLAERKGFVGITLVPEREMTRGINFRSPLRTTS